MLKRVFLVAISLAVFAGLYVAISYCTKPRPPEHPGEAVGEVDLVESGDDKHEQQTAASCEETTPHEQFKLLASDCFGDPLVIALCKAVEQDDIKAIDRLVAEGADVNAEGRHGWTPLHWSLFAGYELVERESFASLLAHGADPNQTLNLKDNPWARRYDGDCITSIVAGVSEPALLTTTLRYGGDPNYANPRSGKTPLISAQEFGIPENTKRLLEAGAEVDHRDRCGRTALAYGISAFDCALLLLRADADWQSADNRGYRIDFDIMCMIDNERYANNDRFRKIVEFVEARGFDIDRTRVDCDAYYGLGEEAETVRPQEREEPLGVWDAQSDLMQPAPGMRSRLNSSEEMGMGYHE